MCGITSPNTVTDRFSRGQLIHQDLLSRIGQGQLSLLQSPPHYGSGESALFGWIRWQQEMTMLDPRGILERCLRGFSQQFSEFPEEKWTPRVLDDLSSVLMSLQMQPSIMDQYRRYVVITGKQDRVGYDRSGVSVFITYSSSSDETGIAV